MEVLLDPSSRLLGHALRLIRGQDVSMTHRKMQQPMAPADSEPATSNMHGCRCCDASEDSTGKTVVPLDAPGRARHSPFPMMDLDNALHLIDKHVALGQDVMTISVGDGVVGHVLAEDVCAGSDLPPCATTNVDGYAVKCSEVSPGIYATVDESSSSDGNGLVVHRINTGQALPANTDAVIMVEDTELVETGGEGRIKILQTVARAANVRAPGSDLRKGQIAIKRGTAITPLGGEVGTLAFVGRSTVSVFKKPKTALLSTGNELVDLQSASSAPRPDARIIDANRPGLKAAIQGQGFGVVDCGIVEDDENRLLQKLKHALSEAEVVITTGGTSMGSTDLLKLVIQRDLNATIHFGRVAMKPGKPTAFATLLWEGKMRSIFTLPGNPASAMVCFYIFVLPALRKLAAWPASAAPHKFGQPGGWPANPWSLARVPVLLDEAVNLDPRPEFHRVFISLGSDGLLHAASTGKQRSR